ncbi:hypothetical protein Scep_004403 [Stephania cephalantha]|uniref:Uncharacterized protein n=1 Tax=Stephania cephalantha TaxID=152367 RepID=A0AAP0KV92_9MAGN
MAGELRYDGGQRRTWRREQPAGAIAAREPIADGGGTAAAAVGSDHGGGRWPASSAAPARRSSSAKQYGWRVVDRSDARFRQNRDDAMEARFIHLISV